MLAPPAESSRVAFIDNLRLYGMLMVVGVHALGRAQLPMSMETRIAFIVGTVAVPIFFLADGFLFAFYGDRKEGFDYCAYMKKSAYRLLVPWFAFSCLYIVLRLGLERLGYLQYPVIMGGGADDVLRVMYLSMAAPQMYFLLSLFLVRTIAPLYKQSLDWPVQWSVLGFLAYTAVFRSINAKSFFLPGADPVLLAFWGLQFYLLGIVLYRFHPSVRQIAVWAAVCGVVVCIGFRLYWPEYQAIIQYAYLAAIYAMSILVTHRCAPSPAMARYNMGIYLMHTPVLLTITSISLGMLFDKASVLFFVAATISTFLLSATVTKGMMGVPGLRIILGEKPLVSTARHKGQVAV